DDIGEPHGVVRVEAAHEILLAADDTDRQATADRFAVHHPIGPHPATLLRAACCETDPAVDFVENHRNVASRADFAQLAQPLSVWSMGILCLPHAACEKNRIARRG